jgi:hypothetical protein
LASSLVPVEPGTLLKLENAIRRGCKRHTTCYDRPIKPISWNPQKNAVLKAQRGVSFEDVVFHIMAGDILDTIDHPNQERYPGQQIHVVAIEEYVFLVPFVESEDEVFLKTVIPSRRATKNYQGGNR